MKKVSRITLAVSLLILIGIFGLYSDRAQTWVKFDQLDHFSILYPSGWTAYGNGDGLEVISHSDAPIATSQLIAVNQSRIDVIDEGRKPGVSIDGVSRKYLHDPHPDWDRAIVLLSQTDTPVGARGGCRSLRKTVVKIPLEAPENLPKGITASNLIQVNFFCELDGRIISVLETNWEGDPHQGDYERAALYMAKSIRGKTRIH